MHYDEHKKYNEIICFMIFVSSFISFNALGFNPVYIFITLFISIQLCLIIMRGVLSNFSLITLMFSLLFCISQLIALKYTNTALLVDDNINYLSFIIFVLSIVYAVPFYEFFRRKSISFRHAIYKWGGVLLCFYLTLELISRLLIGNASLGLLYGFKKSLFYFDSNFTGLIILSFLIFFMFIRNIGAKGFGWLMVYLSIMLLFTMSRAAMVASIVSFAIFYSHKKYKWKAYVALISYIFLFLLLSYVYLFENVSFIGVDGSFNSKFYLVQKAVFLYENLPFTSITFGIGLGNFEKYTGSFAHNIFLTMIVEMGFIGSLLFISFIIYSIVRSNGSALYIWLPTLVCGVSLFGVYSPYLFMINAAILLESEKNK